MTYLPLLFVWIALLTGEPERVEVTRFSDKVTVAFARTGQEKTLFYINKTILLEERDRVNQGSGAHSECRFEDGTLISFFSSASIRFEELVEKRHTVLLETFTRFRLNALNELVVILPGATRLSVQGGEAYVELDEGWIHVRNAGQNDLHLSGHLLEAKDRVVHPGERITIPVHDPELAGLLKPVVVRRVEGLMVKTTGSYRFEERPGFIRLFRSDTGDGTAVVGGARILLDPGEEMLLRLK